MDRFKKIVLQGALSQSFPADISYIPREESATKNVSRLKGLCH
jgi:hypothetical protein